ncbi:Diacetylchitobiose uptake system permease protein NgcF [Leucobacter sp. BZR 635]
MTPSVTAPHGAPGRTRARGPRGGFDRTSMLVVFVGAPLALYLAFVIWPMLQATVYSFTDWSGFSSTFSFLGIENYVKLFADESFLIAIRNNLIILLALPVLSLTIGLALAVMVSVAGSSRGGVRGVRGSGFYRVVAFFPAVIPSIIIGIIFAQVYDPNNGILNGALTRIGLEQFHSFAWLGEASTAMAATIAAMVWATSGFYMVLFIAAIRGIDTELFEAARLDGAGRARITWSIVLPGIAGNVKTSYVYAGIAALDSFVFLQAFNPSGGPQRSTLGITQEIYSTAFQDGQFGLACAMGIVLTLITFAFVGLVTRTGKRDKQ